MGVLVPVQDLEIRLAANGGSVRLMTSDGQKFSSPLFPIPFITAIATIMGGPFPHYNHQDGIFSCGFSNGQHAGLNALSISHLSTPVNGNGLFDAQ